MVSTLVRLASLVAIFSSVAASQSQDAAPASGGCDFCVYGSEMQCSPETIADLCSSLCGQPSGICGESENCEGGFRLVCIAS
jgi:hypothetical protein